MIDPAKILANPVLSIILRAVLGGYVVYMSRKFYADPLGYFRKSSRAVPDFPWVRSMIRGMAAFCLWGGCFILSADIAVQIFNLHGDVLALVLIVLAAIAAWFLLPGDSMSSRGSPENENMRGAR
jgi:uncharacterized membrane-anchored protein